MSGGFEADSLGLQRSAVILIRDLVHERTGLMYDDARLDTLADRLGPLVAARGFPSFLDYYYLLKYDETAAGEWLHVMDALTVQETYFWREIDQLKAVVGALVPLLAERLSRPLRIWSIPCATGEEPLTIAILLEQGGWFDRLPIELRASDASPAALATADRGLYRERSFRALPPQLRDRYFVPEGDKWRVAPALRARVTSWTRVNLLDGGSVAAHANADIIVCRNVFIYFSEAAIRRVTDVFAMHMPTPAYLCLGAAESLLRVTDRFDLEQVAEAFVYVKQPGSAGLL